MEIKKLNKKQIIAIIIVAIVLIVTIPTGIYCTVNKESPADMLTDMFSSEDKLINKWQGEKAVSAYEFKEDGTYDSYVSTFSYSGNYKVEGKKLTLFNPSAGGQVVYKYKINGDKLTLTLIEENGQKPEEEQENEFTRVDHINTKSFTDILGDLAKSKENADETSEDNG